MSRPITAGMLGAIQASQVLPAIFVQATMASGTVYLWSGPGSVVWNGQNWQGVGSLLNSASRTAPRLSSGGSGIAGWSLAMPFGRRDRRSWCGAKVSRESRYGTHECVRHVIRAADRVGLFVTPCDSTFTEGLQLR